MDCMQAARMAAHRNVNTRPNRCQCAENPEQRARSAHPRYNPAHGFALIWRDDRMSKDVLILTSKFRGRADVAAEFLEQRGCRLVEREVVYPVTEDHLCELVRDVDGLITGLEPITARVLSHANRLKVISAAGVGFDHIDVEEATRRGIAVCNCHGCNNHSVAELAFGMMIGLSRSIYTLDRQIRNGGWGPVPFGPELWDKTLGIVGLGRVGRSTALLGRAFGMRVLATDK